MPTQEEMQARLDSYAKAADAADPEAAAECFAADGTFEDPVGTDPHVGRAGVLEFYKNSFGLTDGVLFEVEDRIYCGNEALQIATMHVRLKGEGGTLRNHVVHNVIFDQAGLFQQVKAWWMPERLVAE